ncbi:hypothetical protein Tco_0374728 [Tanacetum coccineum]
MGTPTQTPPSPEWTSGSLLISPSLSDDSSPISSPMIPLTVPSLVATPAAVGAIKEEIFSQRLDGCPEISPVDAISDVQGENQDLRLELAEERRTRLELVEVVDGMRRGQEPRGGA